MRENQTRKRNARYAIMVEKLEMSDMIRHSEDEENPLFNELALDPRNLGKLMAKVNELCDEVDALKSGG